MILAVLAFAVAVGFCPAFLEAAGTPRWIIMALIVPWLVLTRTWTVQPAHRVGAAFIVWTAIVALWSYGWTETVLRVVDLALLAGVFCVASAERSIRPAVLAFCAGVAISGALAVPQALGWTGILQATGPAGLFMNKNYLAEAGVMALVAALVYRADWLVPGCLLAALVPQSRGAVLALAILGVAWLWRRSRTAAVAVALAGAGYLAWQFQGSDIMDSSLGSRVSLWLNALAMAWEHPLGAGSFWAAYPAFHDAWWPTAESAYRIDMRPQNAHNDALTILAENGIVGLALAGYFIALVFRNFERERWIVLSFLALGLVNFPFYNPATGFLAALVAGWLCRDHFAVCLGRDHGRVALYPRDQAQR